MIPAPFDLWTVSRTRTAPAAQLSFYAPCYLVHLLHMGGAEYRIPDASC